MYFVGVNRTVINQKAFEDSPSDQIGPNVQSGMNQDAFMAAMEADAQARSERKKKAREEATAIKEMGNKEFQQGNYDKAVEYYTQVKFIFYKHKTNSQINH